MMRINLLCLSVLNAAVAAVVRGWRLQHYRRRRRGFGWWIPVQVSGIAGEGIWALANRFRSVWIVVGILCPPQTTQT